MKIQTASGHVILIDDADFDLVRDYSWCPVLSGGRLYATARVPGSGGRRVKMHRLIMAPASGMVVHHINNDGLDNRRANLEVCTQRQNIRYHHDEHTPEAGVHFHKQTGKWRAQRRAADGRRISLGLHETREAAIEASKSFGGVR